MNELVRTTLTLEQYRCLRCGRLFYIHAADRRGMDRDFGCPYGCDDMGQTAGESHVSLPMAGR